MQYRNLGKSGLKVSELSFGSWVTFNKQVDSGLAEKMFGKCLDAGVNFFDNAEGNITHVGLLLENHYIIHASSTVRIDRIDQSGIFNSETQSHSHKLRFIKKMI